MRQITYTIGACLLLCLILAGVTRGSGDNARNSGSREVTAAEKSLLRSLGLREDANDAEIIKLLDDPRKRIFAAGVVRCRRIKEAKSKLLEMVGDEEADVFTRVAGAEALCELQCDEWITAIKPLLTDKRSPAARQTGLKLDIAGLLARGKDFSQMEFIAEYARDQQADLRAKAVAALAHFYAAENKQANLAIDFLISGATTDDAPNVREAAILALENFIKNNKVLASKYVEILEANAESNDRALKTTCKLLLRQYKR